MRVMSALPQDVVHFADLPHPHLPVGGLQDAGHAVVATRCRELRLYSFNIGACAFINYQHNGWNIW